MENSKAVENDPRMGPVEDIQAGFFYSILKTDLFINQDGNEIFVAPHTPAYREKSLEQRPNSITVVKRDGRLYVDLFSLDHFNLLQKPMPVGAPKIKLIPYFTLAYMHADARITVRPTDLSYDARANAIWISKDAPVKNVVTTDYSLPLQSDRQGVRFSCSAVNVRIYKQEIPFNGRCVRIAGLNPVNIPLPQKMLRLFYRVAQIN